MRFALLASPGLRRAFPRLVLGGLCALSFIACNDAPPPAARTSAPAPSSPTSTTEQRRITRAEQPPATARSERAANAQPGWTLLDNRRQTLADYSGHIVVLDFWATYCPPCLEEVPHLVALQRRFGPEGLHVIGLNVGGSEDQPKVPEFIERFQVQYTLAVPDRETADFYLGDDTRIPQTLVFDRKGRLVKHFVGYNNQIRAELENVIQTSLAASID